MNKKVKRILQTVFLNDISWKIISPFVWLSDRAKTSRKNYKESAHLDKLHGKAQHLFADHIVRHGPFKGMNFANARMEADSIYAKLLGSYETELHTFFEKAFQKKYSLIINIGCEDGYYAVGLALKIPSVKIIAYDSDTEAIRHSKELARTNKVDKRISFYGICTAADIFDLDAEERMLLVVDCEGDEKIIFNKENALRLVNSDMLIEMHLNVYPLLEEYFRQLFEETHKIVVVNSTDDHVKTITYDLPELKGLDYETKRFMVGERDIFMQWMFLESISANSQENEK